MANFLFHPDARIESLEAANWYSQHNPEVGEAFEKELRRAVDQVVRHPDRWSLSLHDTRYYRLDRFPYALIYLQRAEALIGVAVAHLHRKPGYWKDRIH